MIDVLIPAKVKMDMSKLNKILYFLILFIFLSAITCQGSQPWAKSSRIARAEKKYDLSKVEEISGTVVKVFEKIPSFGKKKKNALGFHLYLQAADEMFQVHLGPVWYLVDLDGRIEAGDRVKIKGSVEPGKLKKDGSVGLRQIRAGEIWQNNVWQKKELILKLRDENGIPVWSGGVGRRGRSRF